MEGYSNSRCLAEVSRAAVHCLIASVQPPASRRTVVRRASDTDVVTTCRAGDDLLQPNPGGANSSRLDIGVQAEEVQWVELLL